MKIISLFVFFIGSLIITPPLAQKDWTLEKSRNNIKVYSRPVENTETRELRAVTTVNAELSSIVAIIKDVEFYPKWVYRCSEAEILNKVSETEFYYYQVSDAPWPVSDRDMTIHARISQNEATGEVVVKLDGIPDYIEKKSGLVRVPKFNGKWVLTPLDNGEIRVAHELFVAPQSDIPSWLLNYAAIEGPYSTLYNMMSIINNDRFANKSFEFLKERS